MIIGQVFGLVASLGVGVAGLYVPTLIHRFSEKWDARLSSRALNTIIDPRKTRASDLIDAKSRNAFDFIIRFSV